jgi:hypothetical protein
MRRILALLAAGGCGAALALPLAAAAAAPTPRSYSVVQQPPGTVEQRYGIVRYDTAAHHWTILDTPAFYSSGLTGVACSASSGKLTITFEPLTAIGTFTVDEDESYAGRYDAGASIVPDAMTITIRRPATGTVVPCNASELQIANSNLQVWVLGTYVQPSASPPTDPPTTTPTTAPPTSATPSADASSAPPTVPASSPPIIIG